MRALWKIWLSVLCLAGGFAAYAEATEISYSGRLVETNGKPMVGPVALKLRFFNVAVNGAPLLVKEIPGVPLVDGLFSVELPLSDAERAQVFTDAGAWIEVSVGERIFARQAFQAVPYALKTPVDAVTLDYVDGKLAVGVQPTLRLDAGGGMVTLAASPLTPDGTVFTLPVSDGGTNQVLKTDGSGNLYWDNPTSGGGGDMSGASNLSDLTDPTIARGNLGLGDAAVKSVGSGAGEVAAGNHSHASATSGSAGFMNATDKAKLDGIQAMADVTDTSNVDAAGAVMNSDFSSNGIMIRSGPGSYGIVSDNSTNWNSAYTDRLKWDGGNSGLNAPTARTSLGLGDAATKNVGSTAGDVAAGNHSHGAASGGSAGFMTAGDKTKLDAIEAGADVTDATNVDAAGAVMNGDFSSNGLMVRTGAGTYGVVTDNSTNWNTAHTDRMKWDGSNTGLNVTTAKASLGYGTMADQNASAVAITGGSLSNVSSIGIGTTTATSALDVGGALTVRGMAAPANSASGQGRLYFDSTSNTLKVSQSGGAYKDVIGSPPTFHGVRVNRTTDFSVPHGSTFTAVPYTAERFDTDGYHSTVSNTTQLVVPAGLAGYYQIGFQGDWESTTNGSRQLRIRRNATTTLASEFREASVAYNFSTVITTIIYLNVGDYVECEAKQTSGAAVNFLAGYTGDCWMYKLGD